MPSNPLHILGGFRSQRTRPLRSSQRRYARDYSPIEYLTPSLVMSEDLAATTLVNMGIQKVVAAPTSRAEGAASSPSDDPNAVDRPIYLRACDRCR